MLPLESRRPLGASTGEGTSPSLAASRLRALTPGGSPEVAAAGVRRELLGVEERVSRQLQQVESQTNRLLQTVVEPLERRVSALEAKQPAVEWRMSEFDVVLQGLRHEVELQQKNGDDDGAAMRRWQKDLEEDLAEKVECSAQELEDRVSSMMRDFSSLRESSLQSRHGADTSSDRVTALRHEVLAATSAMQQELAESASVLRRELSAVSDTCRSQLQQMSSSVEQNRQDLHALDSRLGSSSMPRELQRLGEDIVSLKYKVAAAERAAARDPGPGHRRPPSPRRPGDGLAECEDGAVVAAGSSDRDARVQTPSAVTAEIDRAVRRVAGEWWSGRWRDLANGGTEMREELAKAQAWTIAEVSKIKSKLAVHSAMLEALASKQDTECKPRGQFPDPQPAPEISPGAATLPASSYALASPAPPPAELSRLRQTVEGVRCAMRELEAQVSTLPDVASREEAAELRQSVAALRAELSSVAAQRDIAALVRELVGVELGRCRAPAVPASHIAESLPDCSAVPASHVAGSVPDCSPVPESRGAESVPDLGPVPASHIVESVQDPCPVPAKHIAESVAVQCSLLPSHMASSSQDTGALAERVRKRDVVEQGSPKGFAKGSPTQDRALIAERVLKRVVVEQGGRREDAPGSDPAAPAAAACGVAPAPPQTVEPPRDTQPAPAALLAPAAMPAPAPRHEAPWALSAPRHDAELGAQGRALPTSVDRIGGELRSELVSVWRALAELRGVRGRPPPEAFSADLCQADVDPAPSPEESEPSSSPAASSPCAPSSRAGPMIAQPLVQQATARRTGSQATDVGDAPSPEPRQRLADAGAHFVPDWQEAAAVQMFAEPPWEEQQQPAPVASERPQQHAQAPQQREPPPQHRSAQDDPVMDTLADRAALANEQRGAHEALEALEAFARGDMGSQVRPDEAEGGGACEVTDADVATMAAHVHAESGYMAARGMDGGELRLQAGQQVLYRHPGGQDVWVDATVAAARDADGAVRLDLAPGRWLSLQEQVDSIMAIPFKIGDVLAVAEGFTAESQEPVHLLQGQHGRVLSYDDKGNALIDFDDHPSAQWVTVAHFSKLRILRLAEEAAEVSMPPPEAHAKLSSQELKDYITRHGMSHEDCLGRRELIARALEAGGHGKAHADRPRRTSFSDGHRPGEAEDEVSPDMRAILHGARAAGGVFPGTAVTVMRDFVSDSSQPAVLRAGQRGVVVEQNSDGDMFVDFEGDCHWIFMENQAKLRFGEPPASDDTDGAGRSLDFGLATSSSSWSRAAGRELEKGLSVMVRHTVQSDSEEPMELPEGLVGKIVKVDGEGDVLVQFQDVPQKQWIFKSSLHNLDVMPGTPTCPQVSPLSSCLKKDGKHSEPTPDDTLKELIAEAGLSWTDCSSPQELIARAQQATSRMSATADWVLPTPTQPRSPRAEPQRGGASGDIAAGSAPPQSPRADAQASASAIALGDELLYNSASNGRWIDCTVIQVREDGAVEIDVKRDCWLSVVAQKHKLRKRGEPLFSLHQLVQYADAHDAKVIGVRDEDGAIEIDAQPGAWLTVDDQLELLSTKALSVGLHVVVACDVVSDSDMPRVLKVGTRGVVQEVDADGDALLQFEGHKELEWIFKGNQDYLRVTEAESPGELGRHAWAADAAGAEAAQRPAPVVEPPSTEVSQPFSPDATLHEVSTGGDVQMGDPSGDFVVGRPGGSQRLRVTRTPSGNLAAVEEVEEEDELDRDEL